MPELIAQVFDAAESLARTTLFVALVLFIASINSKLALIPWATNPLPGNPPKRRNPPKISHARQDEAILRKGEAEMKEAFDYQDQPSDEVLNG